MNRKRTSIIWKLSDDDFINLIKNSKRMGDVLLFFNLQNKGNNFKTVKARIAELKINTDHFLSRTDSSTFTRRISKTDFENLYLIANCPKQRGFIKKYILKYNIIDYKCFKCGNLGKWENSELVLQLEHMNGISDDNRKNNLCFLCPNCHSQTSTYAGRSLKKKKPPKIKLKTNLNKRKVVRPTKEELLSLVWKMPTTILAKQFNVSDKAIEKWCKCYNIPKPPRGYWQRMTYSKSL